MRPVLPTRTRSSSVSAPIDHHLTPDLAPLRAASATVVAHAHPGQTIVLTSTTYVGCTHDLLIQPLTDRGLTAGEDVFVCLLPGADQPGLNGSRAGAGATGDRWCHGTPASPRHRGAQGHVRGRPRRSSTQAAEMAKLLENTFAP